MSVFGLLYGLLANFILLFFAAILCESRIVVRGSAKLVIEVMLGVLE
jgi:hypothetical protein